MNSKKEFDTLGDIFKILARAMLVFSLPFILCLVLFPGEYLGVFGEEFKVGIYALIITCVGQLVNVAVGSVGYMLQMTGRQKYFARTQVIASIAVVFRFGYAINALALLATSYLLFLISMWFWGISGLDKQMLLSIITKKTAN